MRWFALMGGVGVLLTGLVGQAQAQSYRSPTYAPYTAGTQGYAAVPAPGCATPGTPGTFGPSYSTSPTMPGTTMPGTGAPGTGTQPGMGTQPGTGTPGTGTQPDMGTQPGTGAGTGGDTTGTGGGQGDAASAQGEAGSGTLASSSPIMIGDQLNGGVARAPAVASTRTATPTAKAVPTRTIPLAGQGSFKIAENESPRPLDRVFLTYNYFNTVNTFGTAPNFGIHREVIGFEKTFLGGDASFGMRLPFDVADRSGGGFVDGVGDLTMIFKFAGINNRQTGNVLSGGLVVTVPTGRGTPLADGSTLNSTLLQPWVGTIYNMGNCYLLGFSSIVVPTDTRDVCFISNDLGVGYRLWKSCEDRMITSVTPTLEGHLVDPLNHAGVNNPGALIGLPDEFVMTAGVHLGVCNIGTLTLAGATPLSGPKPFAGELICQFNMQF